jgi:hypothetical protein
MSKNMSLLPHIVITVHQEDLLSLLDSGSEVTCINEEQFEILSAKVEIPTLPVASTFIQGATGQQSSRIKSQRYDFIVRYLFSGKEFDSPCDFRHGLVFPCASWILMPIR